MTFQILGKIFQKAKKIIQPSCVWRFRDEQLPGCISLFWAAMFVSVLRKFPRGNSHPENYHPSNSPPGKFIHGKFSPIKLPTLENFSPENSHPENLHLEYPHLFHYLSFFTYHYVHKQKKSIHVHPPWTKHFNISWTTKSFLMKPWQY